MFWYEIQDKCGRIRPKAKVKDSRSPRVAIDAADDEAQIVAYRENASTISEPTVGVTKHDTDNN